jgi:hypothetical protein
MSRSSAARATCCTDGHALGKAVLVGRYHQ